jgi:AcrR family transcriptional regulator
MDMAGMRAALEEGPARLGPEEVAAGQRRRMLAAMVAAVAEKGYVSVTVADVVKRARVSRATFYEHFTDRTDCFLAAIDAATDELVGTLHRRMVRRLQPRDRLHALIENYLASLAEFPEGSRVCLVEVYAAGVDGARRRRAAQRDFAALFQQIHAALAEAGEPVRPLTPFDFEALVGAISSLVTNRVATGAAGELLGLLRPVEAFVLGHFGLDRAS